MADATVQAWLELLAPEKGLSSEVTRRAAQALEAGAPRGEVLLGMLAELSRDLTRHLHELELERRRLEGQRAEARRLVGDRVIEFLRRAQPMGLTPATRDVVRKKEGFLKRLGLDAGAMQHELARR